MKKLKTAITALVLILLLSSCNSNGDLNVKNMDTYVPTGSISISIPDGMISRDFFEAAITTFKEKYPDVEINMKYQEVFEDISGFTANMSTALMAGTSDDIFYALNMPYYKFAEKGLLVDYYRLMEQDGGFDRNSLLQNILKSIEYKSGLYEMPMTFSFTFININKDAPESVKAALQNKTAISHNEMIDVYNSAPDHGSLGFDNQFGPKQALLLDIQNYIDLEQKKCDFENPQFIELLKRYKDIYDPKNEIGHSSYSSYLDERGTVAATYMFSEKWSVENQSLQYKLPYDENVFTGNLLLTESKGKTLVSTEDSYCIAANSKNMELAWFFMKHCLSEEFLMPYYKYIYEGKIAPYPHYTLLPKVNQYIYPAILNIFNEFSKENHYSFASNPEEEEAALQQASDFFLSLQNADGVNESFAVRLGIQDIIWEEYDLFLMDVNTAEQAAANIQNKVALAINE